MINKSKMDRPFVALVDHGTPLRSVNQIREEIGSQMKERLKGLLKVLPLAAWKEGRVASMTLMILSSSRLLKN